MLTWWKYWDKTLLPYDKKWSLQIEGFLHVRNCSSLVPYPDFLRPEIYRSADTLDTAIIAHKNHQPDEIWYFTNSILLENVYWWTHSRLIYTHQSLKITCTGNFFHSLRPPPPILKSFRKSNEHNAVNWESRKVIHKFIATCVQ